MTYQEIVTESGYTFILGTDDDGIQYSIPMDELNKQYQEYLEWTKSQ